MGTEEQTVTNPITSIRSSTNSQFTRMGEYPVRPAAWRGVHVEKAELAFHFKQVDSDLLVTSHPNGAHDPSQVADGRPNGGRDYGVRIALLNAS